MRRSPPIDPEPHRDRWLISYADFTTLLLALFVVLYAISAIDLERLEKVSSGVRSAFAAPGLEPGGILPGMPVPREGRPQRGGVREHQGSPPFEFLLLQDRINRVIEEATGGDDEDAGIRLRHTDRGLVVSLSSTDFFDAGDTKIHPNAMRPLGAIASVLAVTGQRLRVEGHTDDRPIASALYPSNWELSTARAASVVRYLIERHGIAPSSIAAAGYAEFRPLVPNDTAENQALNRRIDIVILASDAAREESPPPTGNDSDLQRLLDRLPPVELPNEPEP